MLKKFCKAAAVLVGTSLLALSFAACNTVGTEAVIATVNGEPIYRWELDRLYQENKKHYEENSEEVDDLENPKFAEQRLRYRKDLLETLIDDTITTDIAKMEGYDLTEEEKAAVDQEYQDLHDRAVANYKKNYDGADADKKAEADWVKSLADNHMTEDFLKTSMYNGAVRKKYSVDIFKELEPTEADLKAKFDETVAEQKESFSDPQKYFEAAKVPSDTIVYNPAGFVRVKQIMFSLPEDTDKQIRELSDKMGRALLESDALTKEKGKSDPAVQEIQGNVSGYEAQIEELYKKAYEQIKPRADECYAKLQGGADFDQMIAEYNDDEDMTKPPIRDVGLLVGKDCGLVKGFEDAALALQNVGDYCAPTQSIQGIHIVQLVEKVPEGAVSFEQGKGFARELLVGQPQMNKLTEIVTEKKNAKDADGKPLFEIKRYFDRIG